VASTRTAKKLPKADNVLKNSAWGSDLTHSPSSSTHGHSQRFVIPFASTYYYREQWQ